MQRVHLMTAALSVLLVAGCADSTVAPDSKLEVRTYLSSVTPGEWILNPATKHYYMLTEPLLWSDAEAYAVQQGAHLLTLNDAAEEAWVRATFGGDEHFWIGMNDIDREGTWVWASGEAVTYTNWAPGEPNNCGGGPAPGCNPENVAIMNWCREGGAMNPCIGDTWNDLPGGQSRAILETGHTPRARSLDPVSEVAYIGHYGAPFVSVVEVATMTKVAAIPVGTGAVAPNLAIDPGGKYAYVVTDSPPQLRKVDLSTNGTAGFVDLVPGSSPTDIALTPNGERAFVTNFAGHFVTAIDTRTLTVLGTIPLTDANDWVNGIAMGPGGQQVFVSSQGSGRIHVINTESLAVVATIEPGLGPVNELALTQDGRFVLGTATNTRVVVVNVRTLAVTATIATSGSPNGIAIPSSGREAYVVQLGPSLVTVIDTRSLTVTGTISVPGGPRRIEVNTNGRLAIVTDDASGQATLVDLVKRSVLATANVGPKPWGVAFLNGPQRNFELPYNAAVIAGVGYAAQESAVTIPLDDFPSGRVRGTAVDVGFACAGDPLTNDPAGKIAIIQRGPLPPGTACTFTEKLTNVLAAGAIGAIVYNHTVGGEAIIGMGGTPVAIPGVFVARSTGLALIAMSPPVVVTMQSCGQSKSCRGAF